MSSASPARRLARRAGLGVLWYHLTHPGRLARNAFRKATASLRPLPDFLIIGANKCGTTSLHNYLIQHPRITEGIYKEVHYFDRYERYQNGLNWYRSHFPIRIGDDERLVGEATPEYLFNPAVPERVHAVMPEARLIVLVRNPVDRAFSHYHHSRRVGREPLSFEDAIAREDERISSEMEALRTNPTYPDTTYEHYSYLARGRYMEQIERWLQLYPRRRLLVVESERLFEAPNEVANRVFDFLRVEAHELDTGRAFNRGGYQSEMDPDLRERLEAHFAPHNEALDSFARTSIRWA